MKCSSFFSLFVGRSDPSILAGLCTGCICPFDGIDQNSLHVLVVESRTGFMSGAEVENLTSASLVGTAAAEYFAAAEPGQEYQLVRYGEQSGFGVHFFRFQNELFVNTLYNGMALVHYPYNLSVVHIRRIRHTPLQLIGTGTRQLRKILDA